MEVAKGDNAMLFAKDLLSEGMDWRTHFPLCFSFGPLTPGVLF
jgi:hypothetical protein